MFIALPPVNHWQCVVIDQQNAVLQAESSSYIIARQNVETACRQDTAYCGLPNISCRFNGISQAQACTVRDELGIRWTAQINYQPCERARSFCQQAHNQTQRYNLHCYIVG